MANKNKVEKPHIEAAFARYAAGNIRTEGEASKPARIWGIRHPKTNEICPPKMIWNMACEEAGAKFKHYPVLHHGFRSHGYQLFKISAKQIQQLKLRIQEKQFALLTDAELEKHLTEYPKKPKKKTRRTTYYERNPAVRETARRNANGKCMACDKNSFKRPDGTYYLEVHHIKPLAEGGDDTLENAIALCPNCHRQQHHGVNPPTLNAATH